MSYWMYHVLTKSVFPVTGHTEEQVAKLADLLDHRIYFEAELTTAPAEVDAYVVEKGDDTGYIRFDEEYLWKAQEELKPGDKLFVTERRAESFVTEVKW